MAGRAFLLLLLGLLLLLPLDTTVAAAAPPVCAAPTPGADPLLPCSNRSGATPAAAAPSADDESAPHFKLMPDGRCARGYAPITNTTCAEAAVAVGIPLDTEAKIGEGTYPSNPVGCYWNVKNGPAAVYFNDGGNPLLDDIQRRVICQKTPPPPRGTHCCTPVNNLTLANVFSSDMILQRDGKGSTIFGTAPANATITVSIDDGTPISTTAHPDPWDTAPKDVVPNGWIIHLPPHAASKHEHTIKVHCTSGCTTGNTTVTLERVLFGDVLLCAGQVCIFQFDPRAFLPLTLT
jgi:hypothetical protein